LLEIEPKRAAAELRIAQNEIRASLEAIEITYQEWLKREEAIAESEFQNEAMRAQPLGRIGQSTRLVASEPRTRFVALVNKDGEAFRLPLSTSQHLKLVDAFDRILSRGTFDEEAAASIESQ